SCTPVAPVLSQLTIGTPDANGQPAKSIAYFNIATVPGNPATPADEADVNLLVSAKDVRLRSDLSDYGGELEARPTIQITDRNSAPHAGAPGPVTVPPFTLSFPVACAPTPDPSVGSSCSVSTSADAVRPGAVKEGQRAIWQLSQMQLFDGGPDGIASTMNNRLFLLQGVFVP